MTAPILVAIPQPLVPPQPQTPDDAILKTQAEVAFVTAQKAMDQAVGTAQQAAVQAEVAVAQARVDPVYQPQAQQAIQQAQVTAQQAQRVIRIANTAMNEAVAAEIISTVPQTVALDDDVEAVEQWPDEEFPTDDEEPVEYEYEEPVEYEEPDIEYVVEEVYADEEAVVEDIEPAESDMVETFAPYEA